MSRSTFSWSGRAAVFHCVSGFSTGEGSAATLLIGLFALFESTRNPLPFAIALLMMAAVMVFKLLALQSSSALSAWQSPAVPAVYLGLTLLGALLNLAEWWQATRAAPQQRRKYQ